MKINPVSIPHRYGTTCYIAQKISLKEVLSQFLIGTVLQTMMLKEAKKLCEVSIPHRYGTTMLKRMVIMIVAVIVSIPHRYGTTGKK